jgi:hypothetical protein
VADCLLRYKERPKLYRVPPELYRLAPQYKITVRCPITVPPSCQTESIQARRDNLVVSLNMKLSRLLHFFSSEDSILNKYTLAVEADEAKSSPP